MYIIYILYYILYLYHISISISIYIYYTYLCMYTFFLRKKKTTPPKKNTPPHPFFSGGSSSIVGARRATGVEGGPVGCVGLDTPTHHKQRLEKYIHMKELMAGNKTRK